MTGKNVLPLWLKILHTAFVCVLVPIYAVEHGWANFLWFSNIALLTTTVILWREQRLLAGMMTLAILLPEIGWNIDFAIGLLTGGSPLGLTGYMFDQEIPAHVRALSLYHVPLPFLLLWIVTRLGYDPAALRWQTLAAWVILPLSYLAGSPEANLNWTHGLVGEEQQWIPAPLHLALLMVAFPVLVYLPTDRLLKWWTRRFGRHRHTGHDDG